MSSLIRIEYDDREEFPWLVVVGYDHVYSRCRTREGAEWRVQRLRRVLEEVRKYAQD